MGLEIKDTMKHTSLYQAHLDHQARMVPFGGWEMPLQYAGIRQEHLAVRKTGGLFDISHMGEFLIEGPDSCSFLNQCLTNNVTGLDIGSGQYTLMCNEQGGTVDDLYLYRLEEQSFMMVVNASRIQADWEWLMHQKDQHIGSPNAVQCHNLSDQLGALAFQGPLVRTVLDRIAENTPNPIATMKKNQIQWGMIVGSRVRIATTGYTGEDGFELIADQGEMPHLWERILSEGKKEGICPAGLGARDTLRTEMGYPLYGHELSEEIDPLQAGLGFFVDLQKPGFVGKSALVQKKNKGLDPCSVAFLMQGKSAPPRPEYRVADAQGNKIGVVTSGTMSPSLETGLGMALIQTSMAHPGTTLQIEIRNRWFTAQVCKKPLYRKT